MEYSSEFYKFDKPVFLFSTFYKQLVNCVILVYKKLSKNITGSKLCNIS